MITEYMLKREALVNVFLLIDSRIPPRDIDIEFANFLGANGIPMTIVFTKTDKESQRTVSTNVEAFKNRLLQDWESLPEMILTSSVSGHGKEQILDFIDKTNSSL